MPVKAGPSEGTAMGNLLLQAYGLGDLSSLEEIRQIVAATTNIAIFEPISTPEWERGYKIFQNRWFS